VLVSQGDPTIIMVLNGKNFLNSEGADMAVEAIKEFLSDYVKRGMQETGGLHSS
jgi:uncharacterized protein YlzI (FlbEa/FlbD family)